MADPNTSDDSLTSEYREWRQRQGLTPIVPKYRRTPRAVYLSDEAMDGLATLATRYGWGIHRGPKRKSADGNISGFLEALGQGFYEITPLNYPEGG